MNRGDVIQRLLDRSGGKAYLEIGVATGSTFFPIRANRKVAVDPHFAYSWKRRLKWNLLNPRNLTAAFHEVPSDRYFEALHDGTRFDVVLVDGLHTDEQAYRDVENAVACLAEGGTVVMHDCNPATEAAAFPAASYADAKVAHPAGWTDLWNGDVWKAVCRLRSRRPDLAVCVLDCDHGLGLVRRGPNDGGLKLTDAEIDALTYADFDADRERLLNLKPPAYFESWLQGG